MHTWAHVPSSYKYCMRKIYILDNGMSAGKFCTVFCGVKVNMEFKGGNPANGIKASLCTDNPFAQDAIEFDSRFGKDIKLFKAFDGDEREPIKAVASSPKEVKKVKNTNDAIAYFAAMGETVESDDDLSSLCLKYNLSFPNMK